jgi:ABC-2 type transport system ATP-binding protein
MATTSPLAITATGMRKSFGDKVVLDDIDLQVPTGRIWSLLGPNGAGKTTMVHILSTLIRPDAGTVYVAGHDLARNPDAVRRAIGVTGQFAAVDELLTGEENLRLMGDLNHLPAKETRRRATDLLERFGLAGDDARKVAGTYSGGMRRKLDLMMTLVGRPEIIFLDEPTTGLDPRSRHTMWTIIRDLAADGVTIFLTTQYLDEADELADEIALLDGGKFVAYGTPAELKRLVPGGHIKLAFDTEEQRALAARALGVSDLDEDGLTLRVPSQGDLASMRRVLDQLGQAAVTPSGLTVHTPDLQDVFLTLTGRPGAGDTPTGRPGTGDGSPPESQLATQHGQEVVR